MLSQTVVGRARTQPTTIFPRFGCRTPIVAATFSHSTDQCRGLRFLIEKKKVDERVSFFFSSHDGFLIRPSSHILMSPIPQA